MQVVVNKNDNNVNVSSNNRNKVIWSYKFYKFAFENRN